MSHSEQIQSLADLPLPILTVFVNTQNRNASRHPRVPVHDTWFRRTASEISQTLSTDEEALFQIQVGRIDHFLEGRHPEEKALVIFAGRETWNVIPLQSGVENEIRWGKPAVGQLFRLLHEHPPYGIVVIDHRAARFFQFFLGEFTKLGEKRFEIDKSEWKEKDLGHVAGEKIRKTRGTNRDLFEHRVEAQYEHLCREAADQAMALAKQRDFAAVFLTGLEPLVGPILKKFPRSFKAEVVLVPEDCGKFSPNRILRRLAPLMADFEQKRQIAEVEQLLAAGPGTLTEADEILARLQGGSIRAIVVAAGHDFHLRECEKCASVNRSSDPVCATCGGKRRTIALLDILPSLAAEQDTKVEFVTGKAAQLLASAGGIAGWLRQPAKAANG